VKPRLSLATRTFLIAFFPIGLVLTAIFFGINASIRAETKRSLRESLLETQRAADATAAAFERRARQLVSVASEDAGLKAGIGLLREIPFGEKPDERVLRILHDQLREVVGRLDYDLVILVDPNDQPITGLVMKDGSALDARAAAFELFPLITAGGELYESTIVPINMGSENLGTLILGKKFELPPPAGAGYSALVRNGKVLLTDFSGAAAGQLPQQLRAHCPEHAGECSIHLSGEEFLAVPVQRAALGEQVRLLKFESVDAAVNEFTHHFRQQMVLAGAGGLMLVLALSVLTSRSISKPIRALVEQLNESERTGRLRPAFTAASPVREVNRLGSALNSAAEAILESQERLQNATLEFIETMAQALDARDTYTAGHSNRVAMNSVSIAQVMGLPPEQIEIIRVGAKLHDIGKIGVPDAVLQKPGRLTDEEYELIKMHPTIGKKILEKAQPFRQYLPIVELHHEDWDGGGYPYGLKGEEIPLNVRIVHVADVYDAITSDRAYRKAMSRERVMQILNDGAGTLFDPVVLRAFLTVLQQRETLQQLLDRANVVKIT
jgi:HD-GYP domain-containing protein (c-di-GMP phosphodiesterase class II)